MQRVALPSSPAETLRLCEPYADTDCAWCCSKCHDPAAAGSCSHGARERHHASTTQLGAFARSHTSRQKGASKLADPHNGGPLLERLTWASDGGLYTRTMSSCLTLAQMRARSSANDSSPTPWQGLCRETALAALRPCRHRTGLGLHRYLRNSNHHHPKPRLPNLIGPC